MSLLKYEKWIAMNYYFNTDNDAHACVVATVNGFSSASFTDNTICIGRPSFSGHWDGLGASYCCFARIIAIPYCILRVSCIHTLLGALFFRNINDFKKKFTKKR